MHGGGQEVNEGGAASVWNLQRKTPGWLPAQLHMACGHAVIARAAMRSLLCLHIYEPLPLPSLLLPLILVLILPLPHLARK